MRAFFMPSFLHPLFFLQVLPTRLALQVIKICKLFSGGETVKNLAALALLSTLSFQSLAKTKILGQDLILKEDLPTASCAIAKDVKDLSHTTFCSGTLIDSNLLLTANHCFDKLPKKAFVVCEDNKTSIQYSVEAKVYHPGPDYTDTGILELKADMSDTIKPMKIAKKSKHNLIKEINDNNESHEEDCAAFGWGRTSEDTKGKSLGSFIDNIRHDQEGLYSTAVRLIKKEEQLATAQILRAHGLYLMALQHTDSSIKDEAIPVWEKEKYKEVEGMINMQISVAKEEIKTRHLSAVSELRKNQENTYLIISSDNEESSSVVYRGDSGGSVACLNDDTDEWELMGVNSFITLDIKSQLTYEGYIAATTGNLLNWIENKVSEINNPLHNVSDVIRK